MDIQKTIADIIGKDKLKAIKLLLGAEKFKQINLADGTIMEYEGDTPAQGMPIFVINGKEKLPAPDGEYENEGKMISVKGGVISDVKDKAPAEPPKNTEPAKEPEKYKANPESKFIQYVKSEAYSVKEKFNPEEYPWEECIADQTAQKVDCPECVCQAIKNRTVAHILNSKLAETPEAAVELIVDKMKSDPVFSYLWMRAAEDKSEKSLKDITEKFNKLGESTAKTINDLQEKLDNQAKVAKEMFEIIEKISELPGEEPKKKKDGFNQSDPKEQIDKEIMDWRKKYYNK